MAMRTSFGSSSGTSNARKRELIEMNREATVFIFIS